MTAGRGSVRSSYPSGHPPSVRTLRRHVANETIISPFKIGEVPRGKNSQLDQAFGNS